MSSSIPKYLFLSKVCVSEKCLYSCNFSDSLLLGLTEVCAGVCFTPENDICFGTSGCLLPAVNAKLVSPEGVEITNYDQEGELWIQSPGVVLGYLNNEAANEETFLDDTDGKGRWMRTGDAAIITKSPSGNEHITITERIKELIKVKASQLSV